MESHLLGFKRRDFQVQDIHRRSLDLQTSKNSLLDATTLDAAIPIVSVSVLGLMLDVFMLGIRD
jgi:hypothetical protein